MDFLAARRAGQHRSYRAPTRAPPTEGVLSAWSRRIRRRHPVAVALSIDVGPGVVVIRLHTDARQLSPADARALGQALSRVVVPTMLRIGRGGLALDVDQAHHWGRGLIAAAEVADAEQSGRLVAGGEA